MRWWWLEKIPSIHLWLPDTCTHVPAHPHVPAYTQVCRHTCNEKDLKYEAECWPWLPFLWITLKAEWATGTLDSWGGFLVHLCCAGTEHAPLFLSSSSCRFSGPEARVYTLQLFWFLIISSNGKKRKENEFLGVTWFWHYEKLTSEDGQTASPRHFLFITSTE